MTTWFTADTHFGHANIIRYCNRPYASVEEMDADLVRRWNERVVDGDTVWVLGDFALGNLKRSLANAALLRGRKRLVVGNHDRPFTGDPAARRRWEDAYLGAGFETVEHGAVPFLLGGHHDVTLCHFPYAGDSRDVDRYVEQRPHDAGLPLLHGHVHEKWHRNGRQLNVGVDRNGFAPVSEAEVTEALRDVLAARIA
jgi:calcineurin-like phosphoesterase family protein